VRCISPLQGFICILSFSLLTACGGGGGGRSDAESSGINPNAAPTSSGSAWLIPVDQVVDGGPGEDGIPALENLLFVSASNAPVQPNELVIGVKDDFGMKAFPHDIMDWHEIANDMIMSEPATLSYCPLTGTSLLWKGSANAGDPTFGVSGLLYESNLILYDRETHSRWSQMLGQSIEGSRQTEFAEAMQIVETTWETWQAMYPDTLVLSRSTGFSRDYDDYPYGSYRQNNRLLFEVTGRDERLHLKNRVIGIKAGNTSRAYQIDGFDAGIHIINEEFNGVPIVVIGSSNRNLAAIYERTLADGTILEFSALDGSGGVVMQDSEGNTWDIFGTAISGQRETESLPKTDSYIAFWFAWATFFPGTEIYF
jgi:hypothetical protein